MEKDILIFSGQSNMQGGSDCLSENEAVEGACEYHYLTDSFVPLQNPVGEDITRGMRQGYPFMDVDDCQDQWLSDHLFGSACNGYTNLVPAFVRAYRRVTAREVVAVHAAKGSSYLREWLPSSAELYPALIEKVSAAIRKTGEVGRIAMVWLQGESDALTKPRSADLYRDQLSEFYESLKKEIGIHAFGVIRVGYFASRVSWFDAPNEAVRYDETIMKAQELFCESHADCPLLTTISADLIRDPRYENPLALGHYTAKGLELLGGAAGEALGKYFTAK